MKKLIWFLLVFLWCGLAWAQPGPRPGLLIDEADGSPSGFVYKLRFPSGTISSITDAVGTVLSGSTALDDIGNPDANKSITMANYTLKFDWTTDDPSSAITFFTLESDALATDTDVTFFSLIADANGTPVTLLSVAGHATKAAITGDSVMYADSINFDAASNLKIGGAQIDYDDLAGAAASHTTGLRTGGVVTTSKSGNYTIGTDNTYECYGGVVYVTSAATITACDNLAAGMNFTVITIGAIAVHLDVQSDDKQVLDGTTLDDGDKASNTSTAGDLIACTYYSADGWYCASNGWTDGS